jgi:hypothetical protein
MRRTCRGLPRITQKAAIYRELGYAIFVLTFSLIMSPDRAFTRGRARPGQIQYYGCKNWKSCRTIKEGPTYNPKLQVDRCKTHGLPIEEELHEDEG